MSDISYIIRFTHADGSSAEAQEYFNPEDAWYAFRLFAEPDSLDIYSRVELTEYHWDEKQSYPLAELTFIPD